MPEAYTHLRCARAGAKLAQYRPQNPIAFAAGANGPDMLFCYRCWRSGPKRGQDLPALGSRMHQENTGAFLQCLLTQARTPAQYSYTMGFLTHYATDCVIHPYVAMISAPGQLYGKKGGHAYFEIGLDSWLHQKDTGDPAVTVSESCPRLVGAALAEVAVLLQTAIWQTYGQEVTLEALVDAFHHTWYWRRSFVSRLRIKKGFFWLVEPLFGGRGRISGHFTPAPLYGTRPKDPKKLPEQWVDPFNGETVQGGILELLEQAERRSAAYLLTAQGYWQGRVRLPRLGQLLGSFSYETGLPDARSLGQIAPLDPQKATDEEETEELQMV